MPKAYSAAEIAAEAACPEDRVHWLAATGLIRPDQQGRFTFGDALALKMVSALLDSGLPAEIERYLATRGLAPAPDPLGPPAIVFVDLSGFTRLTRERGDESAVVAATSLQRHADATARLHGGRLVKLLGDGAMLRLGDATVGVEAALDLVETMTDEGALSPHAGINAGPVIERNLDVFGQTVNLASRIAAVAGPGEVLASEAVVEAAVDDTFGFERIEDARLRGLPGPVALYRVSRSARPSRPEEQSARA